MAASKTSLGTPFTQDEEREALFLYGFGKSSEEIGRLMRRSPHGVRNAIRRHHGDIRTATAHLQKYQWDDGAFDNAETDEAAAYWSGFIFADGNVHSRPPKQPVLSLDLATKDRGHVEALAAFLGGPCEAVHQYRKSASLKVCSEPIVASLARFGIVPRKSLTAEPKLLTGNRHFWRGIVDGDGCLSMSKPLAYGRPVARAVFHVVGSKACMNALHAYFSDKFPMLRARPHPVQRIWAFATSGQWAWRMIEHLYHGATVALPRKRELAHRIVTTLSPDPLGRRGAKGRFVKYALPA